MARSKLFLVVGALAFLAACEAKIGKDSEAPREGAPTGAEAAEGKAEDGRFSIKGPGFDMKIAIPKGVSDRAEVDSDNGLLYPGASLSGMHIEAGASGAPADKNSGVELRFTSADAPEKVAAWYRDPARVKEFSIGSASRVGASTIIAGTRKGDGGAFKVRIGPGAGGGTDGRLTLSESG
jgi:hypothetical protein